MKLQIISSVLLFLFVVYVQSKDCSKEKCLLGAPETADNQTALLNLINHGLPTLNGGGSTKKMEFVKIVNATTQVVAGTAYKIHALFSVGQEKQESLCLFSIWDRPWIKNGCVFNVKCTHYEFPEFALQSLPAK